MKTVLTITIWQWKGHTLFTYKHSNICIIITIIISSSSSTAYDIRYFWPMQSTRQNISQLHHHFPQHKNTTTATTKYCRYWPFSSNSTKTTSTRWSLSSTWATVHATCFSVAAQCTHNSSRILVPETTYPVSSGTYYPTYSHLGTSVTTATNVQNVSKQVADIIWQKLHRTPSPSWWGDGDPNLIQCFFGPKEPPPQTGRRSVQPYCTSGPNNRQNDGCQDHPSQQSHIWCGLKIFASYYTALGH